MPNRIIIFILFLLIVPITFLPGDVEADEGVALKNKYKTMQKKLADTPFGVSLAIETSFSENKIRCHVFGILERSFDDLAPILHDPVNWCEVLLLHTNIKSCTVHRSKDGRETVTIYCGRKFYQPPEDVYRLGLDFKVVDSYRDFFHIRLYGEKGPFFTRNYLIGLKATSHSSRKTFVRLCYEYDTGRAMETALNLYYSTLGRKKVGFTVVGTDGNGNPIYVKGNQGLLERNSVRFYFALQAFMETRDDEDNARFEKRVRHWYALVSRYPRQLYELPEKEYVENKIKEKRNQTRLQSALLPP